MDPATLTRSERRQFYEKAKLGIFIHWGPSAGLGMNWAWDDPESSDARTFPKRIARFEDAAAVLDLHSWTNLFRSAGARYVTFVTRHPRNYYYPLFGSSVIEPHSPRDYLGQLSDACRHDGLALITYQPLDIAGYHAWMKAGYPGAEKRKPIVQSTLIRYMEEIVHRYRPFGVWLDGWPGHKKFMGAAGIDAFEFLRPDRVVAAGRDIDPELFVGNKEVFGPYIDYLSSERFFTDHFGNVLYAGQTPMEVTETLPASRIWFADFEDQTPFLSDVELAVQKRIFLKRFISVVGRGLNYLLNVGPMLNGEIHHVDRAILLHLGEFLEAKGEAVYGTRRCPVAEAPWGYAVSTEKAVYLYVVDNREITDAVTCHGISEDPSVWAKTGMPPDKRIVVDGLPGTVRGACVLGSDATVGLSQDGYRAAVDLAELTAREDVTIVRLDLADR